MNDILTNEEKTGLALRQLYSEKGYLHYRMSKFEEYDFYARNKSFLVSDAVITFTDTNGKLMALKPDVTLSIVKGSRLTDDPLYKVYYNENVYRISSLSHRYSEISQTGLECIGEVDAGCKAEVLSLAAASLRMISEDSILSVSHLDILSESVRAMGLSPEEEKEVLKCIADKNIRGIRAAAGEEKTGKLEELIASGGRPAEVFPRLKALGCNETYLKELEELIGKLEENGFAEMIRIDFSIVNDQTYYNGIVFRGFVSGIPFRVLAGGQYDGLLKKIGRDGSAIGFAVYLDMLDYLPVKNGETEAENGGITE